jgi:stage II sporulation protein AB (anti-sigma F factor)
MFDEYGKLKNRARLEFAASNENAALSRMMVSAFISNSTDVKLDLTVAQLEEIKVAVSEAVSNAIIHGYNGDRSRTVVLNLQHFEQALVLEIEDCGVGIADIDRAMLPSFSTREDRMGLGFAFMSSFMDRVDVESEPGKGTKVRLIKKLPIEDEYL